MPKFPYFGFPNPYYRNYNYYHNYNKQNINDYHTANARKSSKKETSQQSIPPKETHEESRNNSEKPFLDLFGIKLYFDDILLISLIFFLYNEGVKDEGLFLALILLLLT